MSGQHNQSLSCNVQYQSFKQQAVLSVTNPSQLLLIALNTPGCPSLTQICQN